MAKNMNLTIKNISSAKDKDLEDFYFEINNLHPKLVKLINERNLKIIFADKFSDLAMQQTLDEIKRYKENYDIENIDKTVRGICSDTIENGSVCVFHNTAKNIIGAILYHEIGHLVDCHIDFKNPIFSLDENFIEAYKKDLTKNWQKIKDDKRYRLIHFIQNSTPDAPDKLALMETFAHCFARNFNKIDDIDITGEYFENCLNVTEKITEKFLSEY